MSEGISESVRQFIFSHLDSVEQLEALLYLRSEPQKFLSAKEISDYLRANPSSVANRLDRLVEFGLIQKQNGDPPSYRFQVNDKKLAETIDELAEAYKVKRHRIYQLVYSPLTKIRSFADAFIVRNPSKKNGDENG